MIKRDPAGKFKFGALQSQEAKELLKGSTIDPRDLGTVVYLQGDRIFTRSGAALRILSDLGGIWSLFRLNLFIPPFIRDFFYRIVAENRYKWFGRKRSCMVPTLQLRERFIHK